MQFCNGHLIRCSPHSFRLWRCTVAHGHNRALRRVRLLKVVARSGAGFRHDQTGKNINVGQKGREEDPVVKKFESLVSSRNPGKMEWEECKKFALGQMQSSTPYRTAKILHLCKRVQICDEELLGSLLRVGLDDEGYMLRFRGREVGGSIRNLGMLFRQARRRKLWKKMSTEGLVRSFAFKLAAAHMKTNRFKGQDFSARSLSAILHGLGLLFLRRRYESIDPRILEISKSVVAAFLKVCQRKGTLPINIANALHGCANVGLKKGDAFMSESDICDLVECVVNARGGLKGQDLSMIVWSMGRMGLNCSAALDMLSAEITRDEQLDDLNAQGLSNIAYGFALLDYRNLDVMRILSDEIAREDRLRSFTVQALANIVYSFGLLKYHNSGVLDKIAGEIARDDRLRSFKGQDLSNITYSFGLLEYHNSDAMSKLSSEIKRGVRLRLFKEQALANIVYSFGLLNYHNSDALDKLAGEIARGERLRSFKEQGLANIVYAFGLLNYQNSDALDKIAAEVVKEERLRSFKGQALSNIVYAFGLLKYQNSDALDKIAAEVVKEERLRSFKEQALSNIVYALGLLRYSNVDAMERLCAEVAKEDRLRSFTLQALATIVKGIADLSYVKRDLVDLLLNRYILIGDQDENTVLEEHLSMMMIACAVFNHHNQKFFDFVGRWVHENITSIGTRLFCNILWAYAVLDILEADFYLKSMELVGLSGLEMGTVEWRQITQAWMYLEVVKKESLDLPGNMKDLIEKAMEPYRSNLDITTSRFEKEVSQLLAEMGVTCAMDAPVANGLIRVDIFVDGRDSKVVIECDGPSHYSSNQPDGSYMVLGDTLMRNRILEAYGYKVVCIPYFTTKGERRKLLESALMQTS